MQEMTAPTAISPVAEMNTPAIDVSVGAASAATFDAATSDAATAASATAPSATAPSCSATAAAAGVGARGVLDGRGEARDEARSRSVIPQSDGAAVCHG